MNVDAFFDNRTSTLTYVVYDEGTSDAVVIDSVLDYDAASSSLSYESINKVTQFVRDHGLRLHYIMETHAHADHLSGSQVLKQRFPGAQTGIGARITRVQKTFKMVFDLPDDFAVDGSQFDRLFAGDETVRAGSLEFSVIPTPGHTPACVTYKFGDSIFTGDALFMPDQGTGRCDFPDGSAKDLYDSIHHLYELDDETQVYVGHDYQPGGRELAYVATIAEHKANNVQIPASRSREDFVEFRTQRDATLSAPKLLLQSVQVNVDAGALPKANTQGMRYLKIPINAFRPADDEPIELSEIK